MRRLLFAIAALATAVSGAAMAKPQGSIRGADHPQGGQVADIYTKDGQWIFTPMGSGFIWGERMPMPKPGDHANDNHPPRQSNIGGDRHGPTDFWSAIAPPPGSRLH